MTYQNEALSQTTYQFLLACLRSYWDPSAQNHARHLVEGQVDWELWSNLLQDQKVAPLLYETLRGQHLLPSDLEQTYRQAYLHNAMRNDLLLEELATVLAGLQAAGVPTILLKGAALIETAYHSAAVRPMADLDLLVTPHLVAAAQSALANLGYVVNSLEPWPGFAQRYRQVLEYRRLSQAGHYFLIDLHWGLVDIPFYQNLPIPAWFERAQPAQVAAAHASVPAPEDHLLCLCSHLVLHERNNFDLLRYCDIVALIGRVGELLNWDTVLQRAVQWQLVAPLQQAMNQLEELWPGTLPLPIVQKVKRLRPSRSEHAIHRWVISRRRNPTADVLLSVATTPGLTRKARLLLEQAFPSPSYLRQRYQLQHARFWPLAYLRRLGLTLRYLIGDSR